MKPFFTNKFSKPKQYFTSVIVVCGVAALCFLSSGFIGYKVTAFVLLVTVSFIAMFFEIFPVLLSALLSALIWDYFFIPPRFTFSTGNTEDSIMLLMYFVIALLNAVLTYKIRQIEKVAREEEEKANAVKLYNILLNSLSHELRTPISTIIAATDNLLNDKNKISEDNKRHLVLEISEASLRLNKQVENLLNISRLESGFIQPKKDWCDINELVYSVTNQLDDLLKDHQLKINIIDKLPLFKLDFGLMQQVLYNLIANAALYTPKNSIISINVNIHKQFPKVIFPVDKFIESLIMSVEDNGPGFPKNEIDKVFDKFYRLKNSKTGGTGLGLSIVKGFVEAQGGTVSLMNLPGGGASFLIKIQADTSYMNNYKNEE